MAETEKPTASVTTASKKTKFIKISRKDIESKNIKLDDHICNKCFELHGRDTDTAIQCPKCNKIVGCFWHNKGVKHIVSCKTKPAHDPKKVTRLKTFSFTGVDGKTYELTEQQKLFAELFCNMSMNGVQAIIDAGYNVTGRTGQINYRLAAVMAKENLLKPNISAYVTVLLERYGLTDDHIDKQTLGVINQWGDLNAKVRAIDIMNKKRGSYAPEKHEHDISDKLEAALDRIRQVVPKSGA